MHFRHHTISLLSISVLSHFESFIELCATRKLLSVLIEFLVFQVSILVILVIFGILERRNYILKKNSAMTESKQTRLKKTDEVSYHFSHDRGPYTWM